MRPLNWTSSKLVHVSLLCITLLIFLSCIAFWILHQDDGATSLSTSNVFTLVVSLFHWPMFNVYGMSWKPNENPAISDEDADIAEAEVSTSIFDLYQENILSAHRELATYSQVAAGNDATNLHCLDANQADQGPPEDDTSEREQRVQMNQEHDSAGHISQCSFFQTEPSQVHTIDGRAPILDIRPGDIKAIFGLGDSLTAAFVAKSTKYSSRVQAWKEFRGVSFLLGGDANATTLANHFAHYQPRRSSPGVPFPANTPLPGSSFGSGIVKICPKNICLPPKYFYTPKTDQWNAAISGGHVYHIERQLDYLIPSFLKNDSMAYLKKEWKMVSLFVGSNDVCRMHCGPMSKKDQLDDQVEGSPAFFERHMRSSLERIRAQMPYSVVQLVPMLNMSQWMEFVKDSNPAHHKHCKSVPRWIKKTLCPCLNQEEEEKRSGKRPVDKSDVDERIQMYNAVLDKIYLSYTIPAQQAFLKSSTWPDSVSKALLWKAMKEEGINIRVPRYANFGLILQPSFKNAILKDNVPIEFFSPFDCFHPSLLAHETMGRLLWNELFKSHNNKKSSFKFPVKLYCPSEKDRIKVF